ncbi:RNA polymerase sigma factor [Hymenobacter sp. DG01]|uniref:RNA polymerase sigma factor n=1 Tax=Hymenobacter sp. DG01 TaxID=2584940 RepID=UPI0027E312C3|nr:RNA polymerase sigma factor [Hymenobacter sp. DG01]
MNSLTDNSLMLQVKAGQVEKMGLLFERYHRPLFAFFYHSSGNATASEDLVQNVFYRMLKYRHTFTGEGEFRTWMYHLARNVLADAAQKNKASLHHQDVADWAEKIAGGPSADGSLQQAQDVALLHRAMARLSPDQREVLVLSRFQELKYEQIAQLLDTTVGAVKVRAHRALCHLKDIYFKLENGSKVREL